MVIYRMHAESHIFFVSALGSVKSLYNVMDC